MKKIPVGILGATGSIGQTYVHLLHNHPLFELTFVASSEKNVGKSYRDAVLGSWQHHSAPPELPLFSIDDFESAKKKTELLFSALPNALAEKVEEEFAKQGLAVISSASTHRKKEDIPLIIPEINGEHLSWIERQRKNRGWNKGLLVTKPNCAVQSFLLPLYPLDRAFGLQKVEVIMLQAISGAGITGIASMHIHDNILPYIDGEEEKIESEPKKILGDSSRPHEVAISARSIRIPVLNGHMSLVSATFEKTPTLPEVLKLWAEFPGLTLPTAPKKPLHYIEEACRPQHRLDVMRENGMGVTMGHLKKASHFDLSFTSLSHNVLRGGAGGGLLTAELLQQRGFLS